MSTTEAAATKLAMSDFKYWWDLKIFIRTLVVCGLLLGALMYWVERSKLPEGYVFERLPPIEGAWGKESGSLRATSSMVGREDVLCSFPRILYGGGVSSCASLKIPYGTTVTVIKVHIPMLDRTLHDYSTYVQKISVGSAVFLEKTDSEIVGTWNRRAHTEVRRLVIDLLLASYLIQILLFRKAFRSK